MSDACLQPPALLLALLQSRASFVLAVHKGPDGDAMGAALALAHALRARGNRVQLVAPTEVPAHYRWLPGADATAREVCGSPDIALIIDCDSFDRVGELEAALGRVPVLAQIDHHSGELYGGAASYLDPKAAAAALLVYRILRALDWPLTPEIAICLFTGLATDTGFFRFENTSAEVLTTAGALVSLGVRPAEVAQNVSEAQPVRRLRLAGRALHSLQTAADGRIAFAVLQPEDYSATGSSAGDTEGIIDFVRLTEGQVVSLLLKAPETATQWQVSLRSPVVDVAAVARQFGGGGHARAAGCDLAGALPQVLETVLGALTAALEARGEG